VELVSVQEQEPVLWRQDRRHRSARRLDGSAGLTGVVSRFLLDIARKAKTLTLTVNVSPAVAPQAAGGLNWQLGETPGRGFPAGRRAWPGNPPRTGHKPRLAARRQKVINPSLSRDITR
jgi:hypothetical protein